ncbi:dITP/XTP pyrophosphatase [Beijerinckiaceae bacterium RH AL1]|nr:RdgB/HAM1 family non-canonical purine NTP pyrophosphatase [Beijerinckiaceae bacterium]VVB49843.1 dITP/XTP pyrophosphatase [Beijerinckiaceae bacterium RH CH11]VVB49920.1 dITP/XTP pyrophosphatase [Beijerinckiaceae bacterium RH AL8]VVC57105.1 dITP/XTP pyrophosphatase [Beijerinckiaceae bacterium RH AL1]
MKLVKDRLVIATHNPGKLREMAELLAPYEIEVVSAGELGLPEPEETATTFSGNAAIKAEAATAATGLPAFADDSGLCVAALGGAPGIYSARWAKDAGSFEAAMGRIAEPLTGRPGPHRAHFVSALALARPGAATIVVEGRVDGELVFPPRGTLGFGYDPIFRPDGHDRTFGEMSSQEKHGIPADGSRALSHRARAFQEFARTCLVD